MNDYSCTRRQFAGAATAMAVLAGASGALAQPVADSSEIPDGVAAFPSWNPDSPALQALLDFVAAATDQSGDGYIPPLNRVAVFDMDGTVLCEHTPGYFINSLTVHRLFNDDSYQVDPAMRPILEEGRDLIEQRQALQGEVYDAMFAAGAFAFVGLTPRELEDYTYAYALDAPAKGFEGMSLFDSFFLPMLEVVRYLLAHDFDVHVVSTTSRFITRGMVCRKFGIKPGNVIGTDQDMVMTGQADQPIDQYVFQPDDQITLEEGYQLNVAQGNKVMAICREIGVRPVLSFGNSSGDYSMATYAATNPDYPGMAFMVVCDDEEREFGNAQTAATISDMCSQMGWQAISMRDDWATIFGEGVQKVG